MPRRPDPLKVYEHAVEVRDVRLADALALRLFPWRRRGTDPQRAPNRGAARTVQRLMRLLSRRPS